MKKLLLLLLLCSSFFSYAQTENTLALNYQNNNFNNYVFNNAGLDDGMPKTTSASGTCMNGYIIGSYVFGFSGGALIGWPVGTWAAGGDPEWYLAGIGVGLVGIGIVFEILGKKQCRGYVYQQKEPTMNDYAMARKAKLEFAANGNTVGVQLVF